MELLSHNLKSPLAGGDLKNLRGHPHTLKIDKEYHADIFCLGCTYFQQTKGHFGYCKEGSKQTIYDGSRKDSACLCFREKANLQVVEYQKPQIITPNDIKRKYNEKVKPKPFVYHHIPKKSTDFRFKKEFVLGVPYSTTSAIRNKSGFYKHKTPSKIIEYSFYLMDKGYSLRQISRMIETSYGYKISHGSVYDWYRKFKPELSFPKARKHDEQWNDHIRQSVIMFDKLNPNWRKGRGKGISRKRKWMLEMQRKYADNDVIAKALENEIKMLEKPIKVRTR